MKKMRTAIAALSVGGLLALAPEALASSHREAPFVTKNPKVDGTDFYMFNSYDSTRAGFVTIIANYLPLQDAYGGPNYFTLDPDALYEIEIDNTGDGVEDLTFQFQFGQTLANNGVGLTLPIGLDGGTSPQSIAVPFMNLGNIDNGDAGVSSALNVLETYTVNVVQGPRRSNAGTPIKNAVTQATTFNKPADNIGVKSFGGAGAYANYASRFVYDIAIPNCATQGKMFVGQRAESFAVNLGPIFDLIDAPKSVVTGGTLAMPTVAAIPVNPIGKKNVTSLELEIPASCLIKAGQPVIGGWTTASVRQARVINPQATYAAPSKEGGAWAQVSRLGAPLVNEVVIGLPDKDRWNSSEPKDDAQFAKYVQYPTLPAVVEILFGPGVEPQRFPRTDLVEAFLTGIPGVNAFPKTDAGPGPVACEELRLNTAIPANTGTQNYLGAAGCFVAGVFTPGPSPKCDTSGFPNGRRPGDDVVDIALDVMMGALIGDTSIAPVCNLPFTDGVQQTSAQFDTSFPYLKTPNEGANGDGT